MTQAVYTHAQGEEHTPTPHTQEAPTPLPSAFFLLACSVVLAVIVSLLSAAEANTQDLSAELSEFTSTCIEDTEEGILFSATDGCLSTVDSLGIELENIRESEEKSCSLSDLYEDFSCKGSQEPFTYSSSSTSSEEGQEEVAKSLENRF